MPEDSATERDRDRERERERERKKDREREIENRACILLTVLNNHQTNI